MSDHNSQVQGLLTRAGDGDVAAVDKLFQLHRDQLRVMLDVRIDSRLRRRVDPSDLIQETLLEAAKKLEKYVQHRPIPFYPWLRMIALQRLAKVREHHFAKKRSVGRDRHGDVEISDDSMIELAERFADGRSGPLTHLLRKERRGLVHNVLSQLSENDRELLVLRYLEHMSVSDCCHTIGINKGTYEKRHLRAVQRFGKLLKSLAQEMQ